MMAKPSADGTTRVAAATTCASSGFPPTSWSTFGSCDFRRVPFPAAMIATATRGAEDVVEETAFLAFVIFPTIPCGRRVQKGCGTGRVRVLVLGRGSRALLDRKAEGSCPQVSIFQ